MRRIFARQTTQQDLTKLFGERKPKARRPLSDLRAFGVFLSFVVGLAAAGLAVFVVLAWLAWDRHEFGPKDLRYLLFVRGSLIERIGILHAQPGTLTYVGQGRDGDAPGFVRAQYTAKVDADVLMARFLERCKALGLHGQAVGQTSSDGTRYASCGRWVGDDFEVGLGVSAAHPTGVTMAEDIDDGYHAAGR